MARGNSSSPHSTSLTAAEICAAIPLIERRISELDALNAESLIYEDGRGILAAQKIKINSTLKQIFGENSTDYKEYKIRQLDSEYYRGPPFTPIRKIELERIVLSSITSAIAKLNTVIDLLREQLEYYGDDTAAARTLRAYEGLELHPEIARAASALYRDGHYANAVEASVKALNGLVRLRSGLEIDGTSLMERAFNPSNPVLKFNALQNQSDKDEQKGFMMMFSGAVSGLRNPRAHGFIQDDPERALEFIAFVSLLAKLLDGASRNQATPTERPGSSAHD